jgi:hypothetical protein
MAKQVGGDNLCDDASRIVTFHGAFRRPKVSDDKTFVICQVNLSIAAGNGAAGASAGAAGHKRSRSDRDPAYDESVVEVENGGVLNEMIGLHDDTHLSSEQLRAKYYGELVVPELSVKWMMISRSRYRSRAKSLLTTMMMMTTILDFRTV